MKREVEALEKIVAHRERLNEKRKQKEFEHA